MRQKQRALIAEINITPLTDIFLVLLIIMMVIAPILEYKGLDLSVVSGDAEPADKDESKHVEIRIAADGQFSVENSPAPFEGLTDAIKAAATTNPDGALILTHPDAPHEAFAHAIDAAQAAGVTKVSVDEVSAEEPKSKGGKK